MLESKYNSKDVEEKIAKFWANRGDFKAQDVSTKPSFSIILPPPNITGFLHLGHALNHTIQDVLVRWHRMHGYNTLWLPGTDHAGISTQSVVEKVLKKEGLNRLDLGREKFVKEIWKWKKEYEDRIISQMKQLGDSCDWDRLTFTLDDNVSKAVRKTFVDLYKKGFIYKGRKLVNWSTQLQTAISDIEVEYKDVKGSMWHIKYKVLGTDKFLIAATTRPETLLGDTAICVHPNDKRYQALVGKTVALPLTKKQIPIIKDDYVDPKFGTGVVKITPAHDFNDYKVGLKHNLKQVNLLNPDGTLNENCGKYQGLHVQEARKRIVKDLKIKDLLEKVTPHKQSVGHCEKSGCVIQPYLSNQWFIKMNELAKPAIRAVKAGTTKFYPEKWTKTYFNWMNNIQDWCVSRQIWWGHRIPVWQCLDCKEYTVKDTNPTKCTSCKSMNLIQETDVLDTWFSSALWPFSTLGWPQKTKALKTFYPTDILITGPDIIFFWVARMIMQGLEYQKDVPFKTVYLNGLIRDSQGRKMSKSLGNSIDPIKLIKDYGADSLRFTLISQMASGKDIKFSEQRLQGYKNFINKIWNATRFYLNLVEENNYKFNQDKFIASDFNTFDFWILDALKVTTKDVNEKIKALRFSEATQSLYLFVWNDFCDWYLEFSKIRVYGEDIKKKETALSVLSFCLDNIIKLLHPFIPFVTEEIYSSLPTNNHESLALVNYPNKQTFKMISTCKDSNLNTDVIRQCISSVRNIRGENQIKVSQPVDVFLIPRDKKSEKTLQIHKVIIKKLALIKNLSFVEPASLKNCAVTPLKISECTVEVVVPLKGLVDIAEEIKRIKKNMLKIKINLTLISEKLLNKRYLQNAPKHLIKEDKKQILILEEKKQFLIKHLSRLSLDN